MDTPLYVDDWTLNDIEAAISPFYANWDVETFAGYLKRFGLERKNRTVA
jgi:ABC-2 type transport system ATP-binding protein